MKHRVDAVYASEATPDTLRKPLETILHAVRRLEPNIFRDHHTMLIIEPHDTLSVSQVWADIISAIGEGGMPW